MDPSEIEQEIIFLMVVTEFQRNSFTRRRIEEERSDANSFFYVHNFSFAFLLAELERGWCSIIVGKKKKKKKKKRAADRRRRRKILEKFPDTKQKHASE